jgi:hypothetical protein
MLQPVSAGEYRQPERQKRQKSAFGISDAGRRPENFNELENPDGTIPSERARHLIVDLSAPLP